MTNIQTFIELAFKGGYTSLDEHSEMNLEYLKKIFTENIEKVVSDPTSWQAVGKYKDWDDSLSECKSGCGCTESQAGHDGHCVWTSREPESLSQQKLFIEEIWKGKTIEQALGEILK